MPVWTHPYSIWWGKGWAEPGLLQTYGINVAHVEEEDVACGPGDPTHVGADIHENTETADRGPKDVHKSFT